MIPSSGGLVGQALLDGNGPPAPRLDLERGARGNISEPPQPNGDAGLRLFQLFRDLGAFFLRDFDVIAKIHVRPPVVLLP